MTHNKINLPEKICINCTGHLHGEKWERSWDEARFCSKNVKGNIRNRVEKIILIILAVEHLGFGLYGLYTPNSIVELTGYVLNSEFATSEIWHFTH